MPPRDTRTGAVLESIVLPALAQGGYNQYIKRTDLVTILDLEHFVAKANKGQL
jgi:hypothetical protein